MLRVCSFLRFMVGRFGIKREFQGLVLIRHSVDDSNFRFQRNQGAGGWRFSFV